MRSNLSRIAHPRFALPASMVLVAGGIVLLLLQLRSFGHMRAESLRLAGRLPELQSHVRLLESRLEAQRSFGNDVRASLEEQAAAYVLPDSFDSARAVRAVQETMAALQAHVSADLAFVDLTFSSASGQGERTAVLRGRGGVESVSRLLGILAMSGYLHVRDVLGDDTDTFLLLLESEYPLGLSAAERFLSTDLLSYAADPDVHEQRLLLDVPGSLAPDVRAYLLDAGLGDVRLRLSPVAPRLRDRRAWPLPLLFVRTLSYEAGSFRMELVFPVRDAG